ncbi:MAG: DUF4351 domain-containing protein [Pseudomonadota bacterium]|nr:DUF4351 domain-containing protein [Pseudomonadota bacterium]
MLNLFDKEENKQAFSLLFNWFKQLVVHGRRESIDYEALERVYTRKTEVKNMLETAIAQEREKYFAQGEAQGEVQGQAKLFIALLEKRFSPLTPEQKAFIYQLETSQLLDLTEQLWQAQSLADIFAERE